MSVSNIPIIVTRAEPGASETVQRLQALGYTVLSAPALTLSAKPDTALPAPSEISGLVFTSANGVRALADRQDDRAGPAWCVGPATAAAARAAGFTTIHESAGNAIDLARFITAHSTPSEKPLLHVANAAAAGHLKRELESLGFRVVFAPLYEMHPATQLPAGLLDLIASDARMVIMVHSAKGAAAFGSLLKDHDPRHCSLVAISEQASAPLDHITPDHTFIASTPNEEGLLRALTHAIATLSA